MKSESNKFPNEEVKTREAEGAVKSCITDEALDYLYDRLSARWESEAKSE